MTDWLSPLVATHRAGVPAVLVTVARTKGSAPREPGTKMLVTRSRTHGTIGGGSLEFKAIEIARRTLAEGISESAGASLRRFPLGPTLGQCCGGMVVLLFEPIGSAASVWIDDLMRATGEREAMMVTSLPEAQPSANKLVVTINECRGTVVDATFGQRVAVVARELLSAGSPVTLRKVAAGEQPQSVLFEPLVQSDFSVVLFGAGHVGSALVRVLETVPCKVTWVDSRRTQFPSETPDNCSIVVCAEPHLTVARAPAGSYFVVMTHSHPLDQAICERVLWRNDFHYCGLIGSGSKLSRFRKRLGQAGVASQALDNLTCPIGIDGVSGKHPGEIAVAVAAELLQVRERVTQGGDTKSQRGSVRNLQ